MRILAHGASLERATSRMPLALAGLALRGHEVHWLGAGAVAPDLTCPVRGLRGVPGVGAQVVVGGAESPLQVALCGWLAGAHVMLLDLTGERLDRWGGLDRWAWHSLYSAGLVEEAEAAVLGADPRGLEHERIGLWPSESPARSPDAAHPDTEVLERACERALARHRGGGGRPAVFLDRDGTLIRETGYLSDPEAVELLSGVGPALRSLSEAGYPLIVVSNQSGIARGMYSAARAHAVMARLRERLREQGVELDAVYFCPHRPEDGCACRKPRTGLFERAAEDLGLALGESVTIGDKAIDVAAGRAAGGGVVLVRTGYGREEEEKFMTAGPQPDAVCDDLAAAAEWILDRT
jgi:D-glycero-D-manno-heptose 1,7-bisphosphate phosphatase